MNSKNGVGNVGSKLLGEGAVKLGRKRGTSDREEQLSVNVPLELELVEELEILCQTLDPAL